jgi:hypothetical protein
LSIAIGATPFALAEIAAVPPWTRPAVTICVAPS